MRKTTNRVESNTLKLNMALPKDRGIPRNLSAPWVEKLGLAPVDFKFIGLRWETEFTPCTGITAVNRCERRAFLGSGLYFAPWHSQLKAAKKSLSNGRVRRLTFSKTVDFGFGAHHVIRLLVTTKSANEEEDDERAPIVFVEIEDQPNAFCGQADPYDTPFLKDDSWRFRTAAAAFFEELQIPRKVWIWAADWQTVPAMDALDDRGHVTKLHLHNFFGCYMPEWGECALQRGMRRANVVAVVSEGLRQGASTEKIHTAILGKHIQKWIPEMETVENGNFSEPTKQHIELAATLAHEPEQGLLQVTKLKTDARSELPEEFRKQLGNKTLIVAMGRCVGQKLHDVVLAAVERIRKTNPELPFFVAFAVTANDTVSEMRKKHIDDYCAANPSHAIALGRIDWYAKLMAAVDLNAMASLYEPFGDAFGGSLVLPVARGIDGLLQIAPRNPTGPAARFARPQPPTGWLVREPECDSTVGDLDELLSGKVWMPTQNRTFDAMVVAFADGLRDAVTLHQKEPLEFAKMIGNAIRFQASRTWLDRELRYGRMMSLGA